MPHVASTIFCERTRKTAASKTIGQPSNGKSSVSSANYGITPGWNTDEDPVWVKDERDPVQKNTLSVGLSGTYDLDSARSENIDDIISDTSLGTDQRDDLKDKLAAPGQIALDIRGDQVTLATSNASPVTFTADGRDKTERSSSGQTIRVRATLSGEKLIVSSLGGDTDYTITFTSLSNGKAMKVSRRITTDYLNQTVIAESVYNKTDSVARLGINQGDPNAGYSDNDQQGNAPYGGAPRIVTSQPGNYYVPNGVVLTGNLENEINTKVSQNNDRFRLTRAVASRISRRCRRRLRFRRRAIRQSFGTVKRDVQF